MKNFTLRQKVIKLLLNIYQLKKLNITVTYPTIMGYSINIIYFCIYILTYVFSSISIISCRSFLSFQCKYNTRHVITIIIAVKTNTLFRMTLLGVTNSWALHCDGSLGGAGITTIWEFGIIWVQLLVWPERPTFNVSTKFGVLSKPNIE